MSYLPQSGVEMVILRELVAYKSATITAIAEHTVYPMMDVMVGMKTLEAAGVVASTHIGGTKKYHIIEHMQAAKQLFMLLSAVYDAYEKAVREEIRRYVNEDSDYQITIAQCDAWLELFRSFEEQREHARGEYAKFF